ncbi:hypothetical protein CSOJ01_07248 [Colletotrichum sojae]|uniref:Uncharacterized protein n=1 Tax=Colletotrichum sojae TaxID=2175907 RepID=A0A8H6JA31_9PEZI|nr:hypothetical protein CSOJ01_07248 [Colletotrichum sojae]
MGLLMAPSWSNSSSWTGVRRLIACHCRNIALPLLLGSGRVVASVCPLCVLVSKTISADQAGQAPRHAPKRAQRGLGPEGALNKSAGPYLLELSSWEGKEPRRHIQPRVDVARGREAVDIEVLDVVRSFFS